MENQIQGWVPTSKKYFWIILCIFSVILSIYVFVLAINEFKAGKYIGRSSAMQNTITVSGKSELYSKPDLAKMSFSVVNEAKTVAEAVKNNAEKMNEIIATVKKLGVEEKDLKTTGFSIAPHYNYIKGVINDEMPLRSNAMSPIEPQKAIQSSIIEEKRVLTGYDVTQTLEVKIRAFEKISDIIDGATNSGANQVGDLQFSIDEPEKLQNQAKDEAINDAKIKAKELSNKLGVKLVKIVNFYENNYGVSYDYATKDSAMGISAAPSPRVEPGQSKIEANVNIVYEIE